jgi:hypothetical protein
MGMTKTDRGTPSIPGFSPDRQISSVNNSLVASQCKSQAKRLSLKLSSDSATLLEYLAETQGISQNEVIRRALGTEAFLQREIDAGSRILIHDAKDNIREIVFR